MGYRGLLDDIAVFIAAYAQVSLCCLLVRQRRSTRGRELVWYDASSELNLVELHICDRSSLLVDICR
jgi:hypothetical protein